MFCQDRLTDCAGVWRQLTPPKHLHDEPSKHTGTLFCVVQERDSQQRLGGERPEGDLPVVSPAWTAELGEEQQQLGLQLTLSLCSSALLGLVHDASQLHLLV